MSQPELYFQNVTLARALAVALAAQLFFGLAETLAAQDFQSSCACACGATLMTCAAHLSLPRV